MKELKIPMTDQEYIMLLRFFGSEHNIIKKFIKSVYEAAINYNLTRDRTKGVSFDDVTSYPAPLVYLDFLLDLYTNMDDEGNVFYVAFGQEL